MNEEPAPLLHAELDDLLVINADACPPQVAQCVGHATRFFHTSLLHTGMTCGVFAARTKTPDPLTVVIKRYRRSLLTYRAMRCLLGEVRIHHSLSHPGVIPCYAAWSDMAYVYIVTQHAERGDLYRQMSLVALRSDRRGRMDGSTWFLPPDVVACGVLLPLLDALVHIHDKGIIHRDIKPENLLLDSRWALRVADFGLAVDTARQRPVTKMVGTCDYMSPEVIRNNYDGAYSAKVDVWAVGVVAYELLFGAPPFDAETDAGKLRRIVRDEVTLPGSVRKDIASFIRAALTKDEACRPSSRELLQHPWMVQSRANPVGHGVFFEALQSRDPQLT